jgi:putative transposase
MSRPPRVHGFSYIGCYRYFLTTCTRDRRRVFEDPVAVSDTLQAFRVAAAATDIALLAYCVMPDHAHLLVEGTTECANARAFMTSAKKRAGIAYARRALAPLWQEGYHDRVLRPSDDARALARYILHNPVRAGLAVSPLDYPFLGSDRWTVQELVDDLV